MVQRRACSTFNVENFLDGFLSWARGACHDFAMRLTLLCFFILLAGCAHPVRKSLNPSVTPSLAQRQHQVQNSLAQHRERVRQVRQSQRLAQEQDLVRKLTDAKRALQHDQFAFLLKDYKDKYPSGALRFHVLYLEGLRAMEERNFALAYQNFQRSLELQPRNAEVEFRLAQSLKHMNLTDLANQRFQNIRKTYPNSSVSLRAKREVEGRRVQ